MIAGLGAASALAGFGGLPGLSDVLRAAVTPGGAAQYPFEIIPPSASGIAWTHSNAHSPEKFLPETTGAGCAFFDYDNDGWMDIYLVNSGKCDFFTPDPPLRNALYKNNRDGTFADVTEKAGVAAGIGAITRSFIGNIHRRRIGKEDTERREIASGRLSGIGRETVQDR